MLRKLHDMTLPELDAKRRNEDAQTMAEVAELALSGEPEPLRRPLPSAEPYPIEALGEILGPAAQRMHEVIQAPEARCGQSVLAAASLAAQAHADVLVDGRA